MPTLPDFITLLKAQTDLAASLPTDQSALPDVIAAASAAIRRYLARDISLASYDEFYDGLGFCSLILRQYPVNSILRLASSQVLLTITNTDHATNQRALARLNITGDVDSGFTVLGIALTRVASGVTTTDSTTLFATYTTLAAVAAHINGLGNGWAAAVTSGSAPSYTLWASADLNAVQGNQNAFGSGAVFYDYCNDFSAWELNPRRGIVSLLPGNDGYDPVFAMMGTTGTDGGSFSGGFQSIRCQYTAGYIAIPADIVQVTLMTVQAMMNDLQTSRQYSEEKMREWQYKIADSSWSGIPDSALRILNRGGWRSYRRS